TGSWQRETQDVAAGALFVPIAQSGARLVIHLLEPQAPDSLCAWGFFNACFEEKEYLEPYVAEQVARTLIAHNPDLQTEFSRKLREDPAFAGSPRARLEFFLRRHASWDSRYDLYPVLRVDELLASANPARG
ncbi:MAG: peptidase M14, partial [Steroidobacteraceae bacterium]